MKQIYDFLNYIHQERIHDIVKVSFNTEEEWILNNGEKNLYVKIFDADFIEAVEKRQVVFTGGMKMHAIVLFERIVFKVKEVF